MYLHIIYVCKKHDTVAFEKCYVHNLFCPMKHCRPKLKISRRLKQLYKIKKETFKSRLIKIFFWHIIHYFKCNTMRINGVYNWITLFLSCLPIVPAYQSNITFYKKKKYYIKIIQELYGNPIVGNKAIVNLIFALKTMNRVHYRSWA